MTMVDQRTIPTISVVVACHGNAPALLGLIEAVKSQVYPGDRLQLVVVDNHRQPTLDASTIPASRGWVCVHEPSPGLSRARNTGIRHATGDIVLFTDPDTLPGPTWVQQLVNAMLETGADCAGGVATPYFSAAARALPEPILSMFVPTHRPERLCELEYPFWIIGCNLAVRRQPSLWFDEQLGAHPARHLSCEELELVFRLQEEGRRVVVIPTATVRRAIHPADLRVAAIIARAFWQGVSMARVLRRHPDAHIYDSYTLRGLVKQPHSADRSRWLAAGLGLCRISGLWADRIWNTGIAKRREGQNPLAGQKTGVAR